MVCFGVCTSSDCEPASILTSSEAGKHLSTPRVLDGTAMLAECLEVDGIVSFPAGRGWEQVEQKPVAKVPAAHIKIVARNYYYLLTKS